VFVLVGCYKYSEKARAFKTIKNLLVTDVEQFTEFHETLTRFKMCFR
jgi:hypothetical protein